jgi:hypothetical protein
MDKNRRRAACTALVAVALGALGLAGSAQAKLTGEYTKFAQCPFSNLEVKKCIIATTVGGEVVLGNKKVPIEKQVVLQGGYGKAVEGFSPFFAASNGITLSKAPQSVPGGLAGIVPDEKSPFLVKLLIKFFFENSLTGLNSTLELAKPATDIRISENNLAGELGVAMKLPVMVHLENPFLGKKCYIGTTTTPINWELTAATTNPPAPNKPIKGTAGFIEFLAEGTILEAKGAEIVDNAWSAPTANGCGGIISFLVNPIINGQLGSTAAGRNTAILKNTIFVGAAAAVRLNDKENP